MLKKVLAVLLLTCAVTLVAPKLVAQQLTLIDEPEATFSDPIATPFVFQSQHSVSLTWTASADAAANPTLSYNLYRATTGCNASPSFAKINATAAGVLAYSDTNVSAGDTLCYEVTALLNTLESLPSNQVQTVILPAPPTLSATSK